MSSALEPCRFYGQPPYTIAVVHGGPGAPGSAALLARGLAAESAANTGVLEPLQSRPSLLGPGGQVEELRELLDRLSELPAVLVGHSWGAMLAWCLAALHPGHVRKLVLVASGLFDDSLAGSIMNTRLDRLAPEKRAELNRLFAAMDRAESTAERDNLLAAAGPHLVEADTYSSTILDTQNKATLAYQYDLHTAVWAEMQDLRASGALLRMGHAIHCPVVAIHGGYDPHPAEGVRKPLARVLRDFRFHLLERCGHYPWLETHARKQFFALLRQEIER